MGNNLCDEYSISVNQLAITVVNQHVVTFTPYSRDCNEDHEHKKHH